MRRPSPFSMNSVWDELIAVIDRERTREAEELHAQQDAEFECERASEKAAQTSLLELAASTMRKFAALEERRVVALELIAKNCSEGVQAFRHAAERHHGDALNGCFK